MPEYHASLRIASIGNDTEIYARVSENNTALVDSVEAIRSRVMDLAGDANIDLASIPNGHFMEMEILIDRASIQGVAFITPYLPDKFVAVLRQALAEVGIEGVF